MELVDSIIDFLRAGFGNVNQVQGLIIALVAAFMMSRYGSILIISLGATVVHVLVDVLLPVIQGGAFRLPDLFTGAYWQYVATLYVGFLVVISIFYFIRRLLIRN